MSQNDTNSNNNTNNNNNNTISHPNNNPNKPLTGAFQLQTKIRVIIQQLLTATVRKLTNFNQKVDKFQDYFVIFKQNIGSIQKNGQTNTLQISQLNDNLIKSKQDLKTHIIKVQQNTQKLTIETGYIRQQIKSIQKQLKQVLRQNQNITNDFGKTKSRFMDFDQKITGLKQQVALRISKYVQDTANINTQIKVNSQFMKNQYMNMQLQTKKQKEKYQQILQNHQQQTIKITRMGQTLHQNNLQAIQTSQILQQLKQKLIDIQGSFTTRSKLFQNKVEGRLSQIQKTNQNMKYSIKKIDDFGSIMDQIKQQAQKNYRATLKKIQQGGKKTKQIVDQEILNVNKEKLKMQKKLEKKILEIQQKLQKNQDFFNKKIDFLKDQIAIQMSSKTSAMLQQSKSSQNMASDTLQAINEKISKIGLDTQKSIREVQTLVRDFKIEVKTLVQQNKEQIYDNMENNVSKSIHNLANNGKINLPTGNNNNNKSEENQVSSKAVSQLQARIKIIQFSMKAYLADIINLKEAKQQTSQTIKVNYESFLKKLQEINQTVDQRVQKMMVLLTKMRGDQIIRSQFATKQINQIKKINVQSKKQMEFILKIVPALGQTMNIIMSLIFDAEYQHSKIIQDTSLPQLDKDIEKFKTLMEGVLYQFKEKKKPGVIFYRHKQMKKIDIVKAAFWGYISVWQQIFQGQIQNMQNLIPKAFYKEFIQKNIGAKTYIKRKAQSPPAKQKQMPSKQLSQNEMNTMQSFHIRKTKGIKSKQDINSSTNLALQNSNS